MQRQGGHILTLIGNLESKMRQQQLLCGHQWLAYHLPMPAIHEFIQTLVSWILPSDGSFKEEGLVKVKGILYSPKLAVLWTDSIVKRMIATLTLLGPHLRELVSYPIEVPLHTQTVLKDYTRGFSTIHATILHSMLYPFNTSPLLDILLRVDPKAIYLAICKHLQTPLLADAMSDEDDFSLIFDPNKALYLECFQAIFSYLDLPQIPYLFLHHPMTLSEILKGTLERLVTNPSSTYKRIQQCYSVMKRPPLLQLLNLQIQNESDMKILNQSFEIQCTKRIVDTTNVPALIRELSSSSREPWSMLRTKSHLFLLTPPLQTPNKMKDEAESFLEQTINEITLSQILLRLCDNQTSFNRKIKTLLGKFPISRKSFMAHVLGWSMEHEKAGVIEILQQEFSKVFFDEALCLEILTQLNIEHEEARQAELIHEIMLAIGSSNEYPIYLAQMIQKLLINQDVIAPSVKQISTTICLIKKHPVPLILGQYNNHEIGNFDSKLVLTYHMSLSQLALFLIKGRNMLHLPFSEFEKCEVITPK